MPKPTLFWTLVGSFSGLIPMRVTTEKPRRLYGSTERDGATHCLTGNATGRFETEEAARAMAGQIRAIRDDFKNPRKRLNAAENTLYKLENAAIDAALRGETPIRAPMAEELIALAGD